LSQKLGEGLDARRPRASGRHDKMKGDRWLAPLRHHHFEATTCHGIADHEVRLHGKAKARQQRRGKRIGVIRAQGTVGPDLNLFADVIDEAPEIGRRQIGVT
jgi:hypothetical protein